MSYIGTQPVPQSLQSRQQFTGDGSTTTFATIGGVELYEDVFLNGVRLSRVDNEYSFDGTTLTITPAPANGDTVSIILRNDHSELIALPITDSQGNNVLSESGGVVTLTADAAVIEGSSSGDLVRITQTGTGNALVIEDSTNPDSTPFVVNSNGELLVGKTVTSITTDGTRIASEFIGLSTSNTSTNHSSGNGARLILCNTSATDNNFSCISALNSNGLGTSQIAFITVNQANRTGAIKFFTHNGSALPERMSIDSTGKVKIQDLSASSDVQTDASKNLITTSDARLKNEIGLITESGIEVIKQIIPKYFSWKNDENNTQQLGFFAQDIYPVLPEAAPRALKYTEVGRDENDQPILEQVFDEDGNPDYNWGFTDRPIIAMCVKAIQEHQTLIESQQSQIDALTARIEALETA